jgi:hypothetical protein
MCDRPPARTTGRVEESGQSALGRLLANRRKPGTPSPLAARPSAMQCVDTASTGLLQAAADVGRLAPGLAPVATSPMEAAVPPKATLMLKRHSALVRVIAAGPAAQRLRLTLTRH